MFCYRGTLYNFSLGAVGFHQPHEPWHFPARFWDLYDDVNFTIPSGLPPPNMPTLSIGDVTPQRGGGCCHAETTLRSTLYPEAPAVDLRGVGRKKDWATNPRFPQTLMEEGIRGYSAAISFMDEQVSDRSERK